MAIAKLQPVVSSSINASSITATSAKTLYEGRVALDPAIYTITCTSTTVATVYFYSGINTLVTTAVTASGTVAINLASAVDRIRVFTDTGSNIVVTITKTAGALSNVFTGTLDTVTTTGSSTYTGTSSSGYGYAIIVGGGGGGTGGNQNYFGGGGGAGGACGKLVALTGSMAVTIGTGGAGSGYNGNGSAGTSSTFAGMTAGGGGGAPNANGVGRVQGTNGTASGGDINNGAGGGPSAAQQNNPGYAGYSGNGPLTPYPFVVATIGTGGYGNVGTAGAGTGYGAGGGGGGYENGSGAAGTQGVLYVLKF